MLVALRLLGSLRRSAQWTQKRPILVGRICEGLVGEGITDFVQVNSLA
jgi:hypothetical protein